MTKNQKLKYKNLILDFAICIKNKKKDQGALTEEYFDLMHYIQELGSLKLTSEKMNISYRKAWGMVHKSEEILGIKLIEMNRGGTDGGRSSLTTDGKRLFDAYSKIRIEFDFTVKKITEDFFITINLEN